MLNKQTQFWLGVLLVGWAFDFLFWEKPPALNFFLFVVLCLSVGIYLLKQDGLRISPRSSLLLLPILYLSSVAFTRSEPLTVFFSVVLTLFLVGVFTLTYVGGTWVRYRVLDYVAGYFNLLGSVIARPLGEMVGGNKNQPSLSEKRGGFNWAYVRGIIIALPVLAIFASLLSSADPVFAKWIEAFTDLFNIENLPEYLFRLGLIIAAAYAVAGMYLHAAQKSEDANNVSEAIKPFLGFTEAAIVLGAVTAMFAVFVAIQFRYFFGGSANIAVEGYTYSEYARRGFGELVAVAFFSLLLLIGLGGITRRETDSQARAFSWLGVGLVTLVLVMLVSAFQRLMLYEAVYGFSRLRTYTHVFMVWLAILLVVVVVLEMTRREPAITLAMLLAVIGFVASLSLLNVDSFIVRQNVRRELNGVETKISRGVELDTQYFGELSDDAVPALAKFFQSPALSAEVRERIGAALACKRFERSQSNDVFSWQSFHLSRYLADQALAQVDKELDAYVVLDEQYPMTVTTPSQTDLRCSGYTFD